MSFAIENKTVLVTGANRGIGKAIVEEALNRGAAKVYAAVRKLASANSLVEEFGDRVVPIHVDLTDPASITAAAASASDVNVVVNNAGVLKAASAVDVDAVDALKFELDVNVYGLLRVAQAFAPVLQANGGGAFAQLNSVASIKSFADFATYSASKAASYSLTQALRESLRKQGTLVVSVHPGPIQTDMAAAAGLAEIAEPPSLVAKELFNAIEAGRFHVWPDSMAKQFGDAYRGYAENIVEAELQESSAN
ncbi:MAG: SDR family oxidoreductase [Planctomycetales bacterium]|nr:SDR family oxidoreductase [Planctomycetales bacterium]